MSVVTVSGEQGDKSDMYDLYTDLLLVDVLPLDASEELVLHDLLGVIVPSA